MLMFLSKIKKSKVGYTLTELIVVISILAILAVVATPFIGDYVSKAETSADKTNAKVLEDIFKRYYAENGALPTTTDAAKAIIIKEITPIPVPSSTGMIYVLVLPTTATASTNATALQVVIKSTAAATGELALN